MYLMERGYHSNNPGLIGRYSKKNEHGLNVIQFSLNNNNNNNNCGSQNKLQLLPQPPQSLQWEEASVRKDLNF